MSKVDLVLTLIFMGLMTLGFFSGLIRAVTRLVAGFAAIGITYLLSAPLGDAMSNSFPTAGMLVRPIVGGLLFIVTLFACLVLGGVLHKISEDNNFGIINRVLGAVFGALKGLALTWVVLSLVNMFPDAGYFGEVKSSSKLYGIYKSKHYDEWMHGFSSSKKVTPPRKNTLYQEIP